MPVIAYSTLNSVELLADSVRSFHDNCVVGIEPNHDNIQGNLERSLMLVTALNPHIGYEKASALAKEAFKTGKTIRELCTEQNILPPDTLQEALDPMSMTEPQA